MGLDPNDDSYESGTDCVHCHETLFNNNTPKYVLAEISGIVKCPVSIGEPPNGTFTLVQSLVAPCEWSVNIEGLILYWIVSSTFSKFNIHDGLTLWFNADVDFPCIDAFVNQNVCSPVASRGEKGYAVCWWGPQIGKEPIS